MKKRPPKLKSLIRLEQRYEANIKLLLLDLQLLFKLNIYPIIDPVVSKIKSRIDDEAQDLKTALGRVRTTFDNMYTDRDYERIAKDTAGNVSKTNMANQSIMFKSLLNIQPQQFEPWLEPEINLFVNNNVSLIKTLPAETFSDIEQMIYRDTRRGLSPQKIKAQLMERFGAADYQAQRIARDQVNKFNGSLTEIRQTKAGIKEYTWMTVKDGRVRDDHKRLDGTVQSWDKPPITVTTGKRAGERNHPSLDIQCRCQAMPKLPKR